MSLMLPSEGKREIKGEGWARQYHTTELAYLLMFSFFFDLLILLCMFYLGSSALDLQSVVNL